MEMYKYLDDFQQNIRDAVEHSEKISFKPATNTINNVVITGLGGSGIGGLIVSKIVSDYATAPIMINNNYTLPGFVDKNTLVIVCSYSGNTEETLSALNDAQEKNAEIACLTSGGNVKEIAESNGYNTVLIPGGNPPRTTLGWTSPQLFAILKSYGIIDNRYLSSLKKLPDFLDQHHFEIQTKAQLLAYNLHTNTPVIYADSRNEGVALRMRQQLNENAKTLCWHNLFPEMNHNELVGMKSANDKLAIVVLRTDFDPERTQIRMDLSEKIIEKYTPNITEIYAKGNDFLTQTYFLINFVDWASLYLSELYGVDSIEVDVIDYLKSELAKY